MFIRRLGFHLRTAFGFICITMVLMLITYLILTSGTPPPRSQKPSFGRSLTNYFSNHFDWPGPDYEPPKIGIENTVIIYNRVPKTGSTSFVNLMYSLCSHNRVHVIHFNVSKNNHFLNLYNQFRLVSNMSNWEAVKPALYHGHLAYLDFSRLGSSINPLYINIIRKPLDRLVSYYYFLRFGDDYRPHLKRRRMGNKSVQMQTFDDCVVAGGRDCSVDHLWLQIPFFCGHDPFCWVPGNKVAFEQAKRNLLEKYFLVGLTEEMLDFLRILEHSLPRFFNGTTWRYLRDKKKAHLRKTANKKPLNADTISFFQKSPIWQMENEFYEFAREQFETIRDRTYTLIDEEENSSPQWINQFVQYEKIRPRFKGNTYVSKLKQNFTGISQ